MSTADPCPPCWRTTGIVSTECKGCHGGMNTTTLDTAPLVFAPGQTVTVTVSIGSFSGGTGGLYLRANAGSFAFTRSR